MSWAGAADQSPLQERAGLPQEAWVCTAQEEGLCSATFSWVLLVPLSCRALSWDVSQLRPGRPGAEAASNS